MKKLMSFSAGLIFLVGVAVFSFAQQGQQGMMEGAKEMESKEGMMKEKMEEGKAEMKGMMEKKGEMMEGDMKKEATGMMK